MRTRQRVLELPRIDPRHERILTCTSCDADIIVCGYIDDLNPDTYRGLACGCRQPRGTQTTVALERAKAAATGHGIPY